MRHRYVYVPATDTCELDAGECGTSEERPELAYAPPRYRAVFIPTPAGATELLTSGMDVNDAGQMTGSAQLRDANGVRFFAYRFSEATGLEDVGGTEAITTRGEAINNNGVVTGVASWSGAADRAFVSDGTNFRDIGGELGEQVYSLGTGINDAGQVVGECEVSGVLRSCRYTPDSGWETFDSGGGFAIANDGSIVGLASSIAGSGYLLRAGETELESIGPRSVFETMPRGISRNGRYVVATLTRPVAIVPHSAALWIDLESGDPPVLMGDADGRPLRDLPIQPWDVNDSGFAVASGTDERGESIALFYDPRRGELYRLDDLVDDLPANISIAEARGISNNGHIAATAYDLETGAQQGVLLVPLEPLQATRREPVRDAGEVEYDTTLVPDLAEDTPGTVAHGITADGRVLYSAVFVGEWGQRGMRGAWFDGNGTTAFDDPEGELLVARTSRGGTVVGSIWVPDEFTEVRTFHPFVMDAGGATIVPLPVGVWHAFGYDVAAGGEVLAECLGDEGPFACLYDPEEGVWSSLFEGQPFAISEGGVVVGATADDAVIVDDGTLTKLGLGPGAAAMAVSDDGRWVAGVAGHAFRYDRACNVVRWLPEASGAEEPVGRVYPFAVNDDGVVVGTASGPDGLPFAFRWDGGDALVRLDTRVGATTLTLREARDIDANGAIVANGVDPDGAERSVVLVPR